MHLNNYLLKYQNERNQVLEFTDKFVIESITGLETLTNIETINRSDSQGAMFLSSQVEPLNITIQGIILGDYLTNKKYLINVFQPKTKGTLIYNNFLKLDVYITQSPAPERYRSNNQFEISFIAVFPFWQQINASDSVIKGMAKMFRFPFNFIAKKHRLGQQVNQNTIYNEGNDNREYIVKLIAKGTVNTPTVKHLKTGNFYKILHTMNSGEYVLIDLRNNELRAYKSNIRWELGEEISDKLDIDCEPFFIENGGNEISVSAISGVQNLDAYIQFYELTAGIY